MNVGSNLCAFLAVVSLANALPLPEKSHLIFRSSSLQYAALDEANCPDIFTSSTAPLPSPEISVRQEDLPDITSLGIDNTPILYDSLDASLDASFDLQNTIDGPHSSAQVADSTAYLCLDNCYDADSSIPVGTDLPPLVEDPGDIFEDPGLDGLSIPLDEETWIEVHRGSGRREHQGSEREEQQGSISLITREMSSNNMN